MYSSAYFPRRGMTLAQAGARLEGLGYGESFRRRWRIYLAYCEAGFAERRIDVVQRLLAKLRWRRCAGFANAHKAPRALAL
jgi:cyclopropane-fatty-acyl-phospholipid synthase